MDRNSKKKQSGRYVMFEPMINPRKARKQSKYSNFEYYATQLIYGVFIILSIIAALGYTAYLFRQGRKEVQTANKQVIESESYAEKKAYVISKDEKSRLVIEFMTVGTKESAEIIKESVVKVSKKPIIEENDEQKNESYKTLSTFAELNSKEQEMLKQSMTCKGPQEEYVFNVSSIERLYMEWIVYNEARGEPFEGQVSVAATILNRFMSEAYRGKTIAEICTQPCQYAFSKVSEESINMTSVKDAVDQALRGYDPTRSVFTSGARFFYNPDGTAQSELEKRQGITEFVVGLHYFHDDFSK